MGLFMDAESSSSDEMSSLERNYLARRVEFQPWLGKSPEQVQRQEEFQRILIKYSGAKIGKGCWISPEAEIYASKLEIGDGSWVAGGAILRGNIKIGADSTVNPYAHIAGNVSIGCGVRIAGAVAIYGFNHGFSRIDKPIHYQPHTSAGISIGDGTWLGTNSVVVDGINIGAHCVIAAGAVVTKSFGDYLIVGGNPAKVLRDRREATAT
jgi:acetyltransferase-like isoleucine patch superfamily enzyme